VEEKVKGGACGWAAAELPGPKKEEPGLGLVPGGGFLPFFLNIFSKTFSKENVNSFKLQTKTHSTKIIMVQHECKNMFLTL
jgi:hypothetical protein